MNIHQPEGVLNPLFSPWPFAQLGLDIVGPFPRAIANQRWLLIGTDYFISDNVTQFDSKAFKRYCGELKIRNNYSTPAYPQGNGQAKATNKVILDRLKKRLDEAKEKWVDELPHVLWPYRTILRRLIEETPFSMTYGVETVIPVETGFPMMRID